MKKEKEIIWKDIPNIPNYQVSNMGDVRYHSTPIKLNITPNGYLVCNIKVNGKFKTFNVHQLVAITFLNHKPQGRKLHIDHIDWNKTNNKVDNLQILTARENAAKDSFRRKSVKTPAGSVFNKNTRKYDSTIFYEYNVINLGSYNTNTEAIDAYEIAKENLHKWNGDRIEFLKEIGIYKEPELKYERYRKGTSILKGIYQRKSGNWTAAISLNNTRLHLGTYKDKQTAAKIYELAHTYHRSYKGCDKSFITLLQSKL